MTQFHGADVEALDGWGATVQDRAQVVRARAEELLIACAAVPWYGSDAEGFRHRATAILQGRGEHLAEALSAHGLAAQEQALEQERASTATAPYGTSPEGSTSAVTHLAQAMADVMAQTPRTAPHTDKDGNPVPGLGTQDPKPVPPQTPSRDERRGEDRRSLNELNDGNPAFGTDGPAPFGNSGVGPGTAGERTIVPPPPAWIPPDEGAGDYASRVPTVDDMMALTQARALAEGGDLVGRDVSADHLRHFLDNTGDDKGIDVDDMIRSAKSFEGSVSDTEEQAVQTAIEQAKAAGATGPITFPVNTDWSGHYLEPGESSDYFTATGGIQYNVNGQVTVHPPSTPGGDWTYESTTTVNVRDRYNWDPGKSTTIGPVPVYDSDMAGLHTSGLAREYNIIGASGARTRTG